MELLLILFAGAMFVSFFQGIKRGEVTPQQRAANPTLMESVAKAACQMSESAGRFRDEQRFHLEYCGWFRRFELIVTKALENAESDLAREARLEKHLIGLSEEEAANWSTKHAQYVEEFLARLNEFDELQKRKSSSPQATRAQSTLPDPVWLANGHPKAPSASADPDVTEMQSKIFAEQSAKHHDFVNRVRRRIDGAPRLKSGFFAQLQKLGYVDLARVHFSEAIIQETASFRTSQSPTSVATKHTASRPSLAQTTSDWSDLTGEVARSGKNTYGLPTTVGPSADRAGARASADQSKVTRSPFTLQNPVTQFDRQGEMRSPLAEKKDATNGMRRSGLPERTSRPSFARSSNDLPELTREAERQRDVRGAFAPGQLRVTAAANAPEDGLNEPDSRDEDQSQVFPCWLRIRSINEAAAILDREQITGVRRTQLIELVRHLMNASVDAQVSTGDLTGACGLSGRELQRAFADLDVQGIASNDMAVTAYLHLGVEDASARRLEHAAVMEADEIALMEVALLDAEGSEAQPLNLTETCQALRDKGHAQVRPDLVETILRGMAQDGRDQDGGRGNLTLRKVSRNTIFIRLERPWPLVARSAELRRQGAQVLLAHLTGKVAKGIRGKDIKVESSLGAMLDALNGDAILRAEVKDMTRLMDRTLFWLHEMNVIILSRPPTVFRRVITVHPHAKGDHTPSNVVSPDADALSSPPSPVADGIGAELIRGSSIGRRDIGHVQTRVRLPEQTAKVPNATRRAGQCEQFGASEFRAIVEDRGIPHLVHFTRCENLLTILRHGLCSVADCSADGIFSKRNDEQRLDGAMDGVSLSIAFPNYRMFYKYRMMSPEAEWAVLILSREILWTEPCGFFRLNAADHRMRSGPREEMRTPKAFLEMFEDHETTRPSWLRSYDPTDPQAEVMVYSRIEPRKIEA